MEVAPGSATSHHLAYWFSGIADESTRLDRAGCAGIDCEGYADVLAGHHAMGAVADVVWVAGRLHLQSATFFATIEPGFLGSPGFLFEFRGLFPEPRDAHDKVCLSTIFAGRETTLDHWN